MGKDSGKDRKQKEKGVAENEIVRWHHQLNGHETEQIPGDSEDGSLACCSPWGHKELGMTVTEHKQNCGFMIFFSLHSSDWLVSIFFTVLAFRKRKLKM